MFPLTHAHAPTHTTLHLHSSLVEERLLMYNLLRGGFVVLGFVELRFHAKICLLGGCAFCVGRADKNFTF